MKNVDPDTWRYLKVEAARHDVTIGDFLSQLAKEHQEREQETKMKERKKLADAMDAIRTRTGKADASGIIRKWRDTLYAKQS